MIGPGRERRQEPAAEHARFEGDVGVPDAEQVADVAVKVVRLDRHVGGQLALHADVVAERVRRVEAVGDGGGPQLRRDDGVGEIAGRAEDEIPLRLSDRGARLIRILLRRQARSGSGRCRR